MHRNKNPCALAVFIKRSFFQKSCSLPKNSSKRNLLSFAMQLPLSSFLLSYNSFLLVFQENLVIQVIKRVEYIVQYICWGFNKIIICLNFLIERNACFGFNLSKTSHKIWGKEKAVSIPYKFTLFSNQRCHIRVAEHRFNTLWIYTILKHLITLNYNAAVFQYLMNLHYSQTANMNMTE